jgi:hypothetical protein
MGDENNRFISVRVLREDYERYKIYLQYIAKKSIKDDIGEYVRARAEMVGENNLDPFKAHVNKKMRGKGQMELTTDEIMRLTRGDA